MLVLLQERKDLLHGVVDVTHAVPAAPPAGDAAAVSVISQDERCHAVTRRMSPLEGRIDECIGVPARPRAALDRQNVRHASSCQ